MKLLRSTESKIKDKNGKNILYLDIAPVVMVQGNIVKNDHQQDS